MKSIRQLAPRFRKYVKHQPGKTIGPRDGWTPEMRAAKERALGPNPNGGYNHDALGCEFFRVGLWPRAVDEFELAVRINPWQAAFKVHLARAYLAHGDMALAESMAFQGLEQAPDFAEAVFAVALVFERKGDLDKATQFYEQCLKLHPSVEIRNVAKEGLRALAR